MLSWRFLTLLNQEEKAMNPRGMLGRGQDTRDTGHSGYPVSVTLMPITGHEATLSVTPMHPQQHW